MQHIFAYNGLPSGLLTRDPHFQKALVELMLRSMYVDQHRPTGSETTPPHAPRSSRFGSEPPSVEDDVDVWRYAI